MRRLLLLRHAKAERSRSDDRERGLTDRGRTDALTIGAYLAHYRFKPDLVVVSPVRRTRETWRRIAVAFDARLPIKYDERLYETESDTILDVLKETPPRVGTLLVIGHNPGMQELAILLITSGDTDARKRLKEKFPTAALAVVDFADKNWSRLRPHGGRLERFVTPRLLTLAPSEADAPQLQETLVGSRRARYFLVLNVDRRVATAIKARIELAINRPALRSDKRCPPAPTK